MCYAILEIMYQLDKDKPDIVRVATEADLDRQIREKQQNPMVRKQSHGLTKVEKWDESIYKGPNSVPPVLDASAPSRATPESPS